MAKQARFAERHEHTERCSALYEEWKRNHAVVQDMSGRYSRQHVLTARSERERYEHELGLIGCSGEARRRIERDAEIAEHGRPLL